MADACIGSYTLATSYAGNVRRLAAVAFGTMLLAVAPARAAPPTPTQYVAAYLEHSRVGVYEAFGLLPGDWQTPYARDRQGVPLVDYAFGRAYNPTTTAQYGLANWTLGLRHHSRDRIRVALRMADWLVRTQDRPSGKWLYRFALRAPGADEELPNPWYSALAQGQALSLLRRAYNRSGRRAYLAAARRGLRPFERSVARGGVVRRFHGRAFYEEYPTRAGPNYVLNGFMQSLLGLHDLADVSPTARRLFRSAFPTLPRILPLYDLGGGVSAYSLAYLHWPTSRTAAEPSYHLAHVGLLMLMNRFRPSLVLRRYARAWSRNLAFG
jgi:hypothetical protein